MPPLIPEILFAIGKKIVEDGDSDAVYRFALSGREPLAVLSHVFASVTTLKLSKNYYEIGWGGKCSRFYFENHEIPLKSFIHQAGNYIEILHIEERIPIFRLYEPIIDKIFDKKPSFSVGTRNDKLFIDALLDEFASTLKKVSIPFECLKSEFRGKLILDSLDIMNSVGTYIFSFCGKTSSLTFPFKGPYGVQHTENLFSRYHDFINPAVLPVKELIFENYVPSDYYGPDLAKLQSMMQCFPSLKLIELNIELDKGFKIRSHVLNYPSSVKNFLKIFCLQYAIICKFLFSFISFFIEKIFFFQNRKAREEICDIGFEFEEIPDIYVFRKMVQSADSKPTILEVHVAGKKLCEIYSMLFELF